MGRNSWKKRVSGAGKRRKVATFGKRKVIRREEDEDEEKVVSDDNSDGKIEDVEDDYRRRKVKDGE